VADACDAQRRARRAAPAARQARRAGRTSPCPAGRRSRAGAAVHGAGPPADVAARGRGPAARGRPLGRRDRVPARAHRGVREQLVPPRSRHTAQRPDRTRRGAGDSSLRAGRVSLANRRLRRASPATSRYARRRSRPEAGRSASPERLATASAVAACQFDASCAPRGRLCAAPHEPGRKGRRECLPSVRRAPPPQAGQPAPCRPTCAITSRLARPRRDARVVPAPPSDANCQRPRCPPRPPDSCHLGSSSAPGSRCATRTDPPSLTTAPAVRLAAAVGRRSRTSCPTRTGPGPRGCPATPRGRDPPRGSSA
jgi:hypothetical protein